MELFKNKFDCCGCEACANVCSKGAISMQEDENGFRYPLIDNSKCVDCGLCRKVCAFQNIEETNCAKDVYVAVSKDEEQIIKSASGGIFAVIAKEVIEKGGIVCGSALMVKNNKVCVEHILIDSIKDISKLQGSKYVQSNINDCYKRIKQLLADGRIVLFSGTPCQCAGLKGFLRKPYDNLFIIDIICHGVPNQRFLNDYIEYKHPAKTGISGFAFRDKSRGWGLTGRIDYEDGSSKLIPAGLSSYYSLFLDSQIYRENCYKCKYASRNRPGDITLGDYWGIQKEHPELMSTGKYNPKNGISCVIVNTTKGESILSDISDKIVKDESTYEKIANMNRQLVSPSKRGQHYDTIFSLYSKEGYKPIDEFFYKNYRKQIFIHSIFSKLPFGLKEVLRKILK